MREASADLVKSQARRLIERGIIEDPFVRQKGRVVDAMRIHDPTGEGMGWIVPVTVGRALVGFFQFDKKLQRLRYSSTQRKRGTVDGAPLAASWFDPKQVIRQAQNVVPGARVVKAPLLAYDGNISRIAWLVRLGTKAGEIVVFVAGDYAYRATGEPAESERTVEDI